MARYYKQNNKVYDTSNKKWLSPEKSQHYADISGGWQYLPDYSTYKSGTPAGQPLVNKVSPTPTPTPTPTPAPAPPTRRLRGTNEGR